MVRKLLPVKTHCLQGSKCYQSVVTAFMRKVLCTPEMEKPLLAAPDSPTAHGVVLQSSLNDIKNLQCKLLQSAHFLYSLCCLQPESQSC